MNITMPIDTVILLVALDVAYLCKKLTILASVIPEI